MADDKHKAGVNCASSHSSVHVNASLMGYEDMSIVRYLCFGRAYVTIFMVYAVQKFLVQDILLG